MKKADAKPIFEEIRQIYIDLDKVNLFNRVPETMENILKILTYADNFDSGYGQRLRNDWQDYKDKGLENEIIFNEFKEKILQLAIDIEAYFKNDPQDLTNQDEKYIKQSIHNAVTAAGRGFNYKKLQELLKELDSNYQSQNIYSCLMLIRAIIDHIPPLLGFKTFDQIVNNFPLSQTDRAYVDSLSASKQMLHDALHRTISQSEDLFDISDIPEKMHLNRILQICLEGEIQANQLSKIEAPLPEKNKPKNKGTTPPPIVEGSLNNVSSGQQSYTAELSITNKGQELAILKSLEVTDGHRLDLGTFKTLGTNESLKIKIELYGTEFRNNGNEAKLSILYNDIRGNNYKSTYNIVKEARADGFYNLKSLSDFNFFQV